MKLEHRKFQVFCEVMHRMLCVSICYIDRNDFIDIYRGFYLLPDFSNRVIFDLQPLFAYFIKRKITPFDKGCGLQDVSVQMQ